MWRRSARVIPVVAGLLAVPAACSSGPTDSPNPIGTGGTGTGGAASGGNSWGGSAEWLDTPPSPGGGPGNLVGSACTPEELADPYTSVFDSCAELPCPEGLDCSTGGAGGAANGGAAGAAGEAGAPTGNDPLPAALCPLDFPPITAQGNWAGCALQDACVEPPMIANGGLKCCYRVTAYHCL